MMQRQDQRREKVNKMKTFADILSAYERETSNRLSPILERQISEITAGLSNTYLRNLCTLSEDNIRTIIRYVNAVKVEVNSATNYRRDIINFNHIRIQTSSDDGEAHLISEVRDDNGILRPGSYLDLVPQ
jgi:hypothetical protein